MNVLEVDRRAERDVATAIRHFRHRGMSPVSRFITLLYETFETIRLHPGRGTVYPGGYYWMKVKRYCYVVYYQMVSETRTKVFAVAHPSRKPG